MARVEIVTNAHGAKILMDEAYPTMDREIMKELDEQVEPCTEQTYFTEYAKRHFRKYGNEWEMDKADTVYEVVTNEYGIAIKYNAAVAMMDDEVREAVAADIAPCTAQEFFDEYCKRHEQKYGEQWELAKENPIF